MTTIYLTQHQYQQVLDGMITTHLDVLDHNGDGILTQSGDGYVPIAHSILDDAHGKEYLWAHSSLYDPDDEASNDALLDIDTIGLSLEPHQAISYSDSATEFGGELYGYNLETLNKIIDAYNNGLSYCDEDFDKIVYDGVGATGKKAPKEKYKSAQELNMQNIAKYNTAYSEEEEAAMLIYELKQIGATDFKYTADGMLASYKVNGTLYEVSPEEYGEFSANDARTQELLAMIDTMDTELNTAKAEQAEMEAEQAELEAQQTELEEDAADANAQIAKQTEKLADEVKESIEIEEEIQDVYAEIQEENQNNEKASNSKTASLNNKASNLSGKLSSVKSNITLSNFALSYSKLAASSINASLSKVSLDVANVGAKVDMKSAEINALKAQIDAKKAELASL